MFLVKARILDAALKTEAVVVSSGNFRAWYSSQSFLKLGDTMEGRNLIRSNTEGAGNQNQLFYLLLGSSKMVIQYIHTVLSQQSQIN